MSLTLYFHPLSSFCHKALIALYENGTPFTPRIVDLGDPRPAPAFRAIWPIGKFPVLRDEATDRLIAGVEHHHRVPRPALSGRGRGSCRRRGTRAADAACATASIDLYVHVPMQKIVTDRLRPTDKKDPFGVDEARMTLDTALGIVDRAMADKTWAMGDTFTLADCSAGPPLFYASMMPFAGAHPNADRYLERLMERPSYARTIAEARPYLHLFPKA